jgi:tRNA threonylcarbamoyladenosine biosynthesis protein TsaB
MTAPPTFDVVCLHTTESVGSVAVACGDRVASCEFEARGQHAPALLGAVRRLLLDTGVQLEELKAVAVTTGPGSFTGIRIGLATAMGLAAARGWPVLGCDSLLAVAAAFGTGARERGIVLDARRGEVYAALYDATGPVPRAIVPPFCATAGVAAARFAPQLRDQLEIAGSGADLIGPALEVQGLEVRILRPNPGSSVAAALVTLCRAGGLSRDPAQEIEPTYLRKSDAEIRRDDALRTGA